MLGVVICICQTSEKCSALGEYPLITSTFLNEVKIKILLLIFTYISENIAD